MRALPALLFITITAFACQKADKTGDKTTGSGSSITTVTTGSGSGSAGTKVIMPPAAPAKDIDSKDILARTEKAEEVDVKHVLIGWKDLAASYGGHMDPRAAQRTNDDAAKLAQETLAKLKADPKQIDALVKELGEDPGAAKGNPYTIKDDTPFVPEFKNLALRLKLDEAGIVKTSFGYHVIERIAPPPPDPLESADILARPPEAGPNQVQHILLGWKDIGGRPDPRADKRTKADADKLATDLLARVRKGEDMAKLMKEFSEDPGSKDTGKPYEVTPAARLVDPFKKLGLRLKLGEAGLVKTQFGWHVIKRVPPPPPPPPDSLDSKAILDREPVTEKAKVKHILLGWKDVHAADERGKTRERPALEKLVKDTVAKLTKGDPIEPIMAELSEDPGYASAVARRGIAVIVVGAGADAELLRTLHRAGATIRIVPVEGLFVQIQESAPDAVVVDLGDDEEGTLLAELCSRIPDSIRLIAIGDLREMSQTSGGVPDCVVFPHPDEETLRGVLTWGTTVDAAVLVRELLNLSVFGQDLPTTLQGLASHMASAFDADNCVILLPEGTTCYTARPISDDVLADLAPLSEIVCDFGTTVIVPPRADRPYRAFIGLPLAHNNAPPIAMILLCRESPVPFGRDALAHLRNFAMRMSADLSWRLVHERLLSDRDKLRELSRIDPVLGVANRTALQEELSRRVVDSARRGEPFSVAVIDVDGLRLINERSGYPAGDDVLAHVAQVARKEARAQDLVARYAGDSVAVVFPGASTDEATALLTRILTAIDATQVMHEDMPINLTVSAGIAELRYDIDTGEAALGRAMAARERARRHGEVIALADAAMREIPAQPDFEIGTTLGGVYQIRHEISRGAFGVVYRAEDLALGRQVALKLLRPDLARDTNFVDGFRKEAATLARIRNPNLVQVYAFGAEGAYVYFAMELVEGQSLDKRIASARKRRRHLPIPEVVNIIDEIAGALEAVHRVGMLHRDVKPENILVDRIHRRCVLVDVGIAVRRGEKNPAGTPGFTAPEVFGAGGESRSTDVYSLGALAYMLLTLEAPFVETSPLEILSLQAKRPRPLTDLRKDLPAAINDVVLQALDPDPALRPQSARELAKSMADVMARLTIQPRRTVEIPSVASPLADVRRSLTSYVPSMRTGYSQPSLRTGISQPTPTVQSTRGVLFRAAYEVLGARRGNDWIAEISRRLPELVPALAPQGSPLAWYPTTSFIAALESLGEDDTERRMIAWQVGRTAIDQSFEQFYGADPSALTPEQVLGAVDLFWRSYHSWGAAAVMARDTDAEITLVEGLASPLLCLATAGLLSGVVNRAGGTAVEVMHPVCVATGGDRCTFQLSWRLADPMVSASATIRDGQL
ncbi:MAG: peptidylprolyl isomerase [Proteobacteria bacterium]|nr:peptidylprolyl isomerase [Pseudomonadota bacterium]